MKYSGVSVSTHKKTAPYFSGEVCATLVSGTANVAVTQNLGVGGVWEPMEKDFWLTARVFDQTTRRFRKRKQDLAQERRITADPDWRYCQKLLNHTCSVEKAEFEDSGEASRGF